MNIDQVYLKPDLVIEPLFNNWYAGSNLISPATSAMNIVGKHLKIIDSYIQSLAAFTTVIKSQKILEGLLIDYEGELVVEIEQLSKNILENQEERIFFSESVRKLDLMLEVKAQEGYFIEPLNEENPEVLKGDVGLIFELNNQSSFVFFESLSLNGEFYKETSQSILLLLNDNRVRPLVLSASRLDDKDKTLLNISFSRNRLDVLNKMRRTLSSLSNIKKK